MTTPTEDIHSVPLRKGTLNAQKNPNAMVDSQDLSGEATPNPMFFIFLTCLLENFVCVSAQSRLTAGEWNKNDLLAMKILHRMIAYECLVKI